MKSSWNIAICSLLCSAACGVAADLAPEFAKIKSVKSEGTGNADAKAAWKKVVSGGIDALIPTLAAMDDADAVAANWLRLAAQAIVEKGDLKKDGFAKARLESFIYDTKHAPNSRR